MTSFALGKLGKRGSASDIIVIVCVLFTLMLGIFITYFATDTMKSQLMGVSAINESQGFGTAMDGVGSLINRLDYFGVGVFVAFIIGLLVTAWFVASHPIFSIAFVIVDVVMVCVASALNYVWEQVTSMSVFGTTINHFPIMNHILSNFALYTGIIGILGLVIMYAKPGGAR